MMCRATATPAAPAPGGDAGRRPLAVVTGATGFIGRRLTRALAESGWRVRLLLRRDPASLPGLRFAPEVVAGSLEDAAALARLAEDADVIFHVAGLIKAARRETFFRVNRDGAARFAGIARQTAPGAHFILFSSLAARVPGLSDYAASKRAGEDAVREQLGSAATILRPPAVYGPCDRETLRFFQMASGRIVPVPGAAAARAALIHVDDLVRLALHLAAGPPTGGTLTASDARPEGYRWEEVLATAARAVGNATPRLVRMPYPLLKTIALAGDLGRLFGSAAMLHSQKLRELRHPDWSVSPAERAVPAGWAPAFDLETGFADAVAGYRAAGWLPAARSG